MYRILIQVLEVEGNRNPLVHEIIGKEVGSIQEAFESIGSVKELFEGYLACEQETIKSVNEIVNK